MKLKLVAIVLLCLNITNLKCQILLSDLKKSEKNINFIDKYNLKQGKWYLCLNQSEIIYANVNYINDTLNGNYLYYFINTGKISLKGNYKNGLKEGIETAYWEDGKIRGTSNYLNGMLDGISESFNQKGELSARINYINGKIDTSFKNEYFHPNFVPDIIEEKFDTFYNEILNITTVYKNEKKFYSYMIYKKRKSSETFYESDTDYKRVVFRRRGKENRILKVFYFKNETLTRTEFYNKKGLLKNTIKNL